MHTYERFIAPGLGVVIVLAIFILGVPLVYQVLLGLLGLAAAATWFAPYRVQVETRIAIAALGLVILLIVSSVAFWMTLLSFAVIGALQYPHRHTLQRNPATIEWLSGMVKDLQERRANRAAAGGDVEEETGVAAGDGGEDAAVAPAAAEGRSAARPPSGGGALPGFLRMNVAGVGGLVAGALVVGSVFMPWLAFLASAFGEMAAGNLTLRAAAAEMELPALNGFFYALLALGVGSIICIVLPRIVAAIIAAAGLAVTFASYLYVFAQVEREVAQLSGMGVGVLTLPAVGSLLAAFCFVVMFVLQLIPAANRTE